MTELIFAPIRDKIERAVRNSERLHLDPAQVLVLVKSPLWRMLAELTAKEFSEQWQDNPLGLGSQPPEMTTLRGLSSDSSGSNIAPNETTGRSAGTIEQHVHDAAERRALEAAATVGRRKRRGRRLPDTI